MNRSVLVSAPPIPIEKQLRKLEAAYSQKVKELDAANLVIEELKQKLEDVQNGR